MATCSIDVYIKLPSGKAICSQHLASDTVQQIANYVAKGEGVAESRIRLKYQGKTLNKSKTIGYLGIRAETILKAEVLFPKAICVVVKLPNGNSESLRLENIDTVLTLKKQIQEYEDIAPAHQVLKISSGQTVSGDSNILCDVGVVDETVLTVYEEKPTPKISDVDNSLITDEVDEEKKQDLINTFEAGGRNVEVVFCFDTTGSMYSCLSTVRQRLRETCQRLIRDVPRIRIGIMAVGDYCDNSTYVTRHIDLTSDVDALVDFGANVPSTGGGDAPEVRSKLRETCTRLLRDIPNIRIGIMANGDYLDDESAYVVKYVDLTSDTDTVVHFAETVRSTGGGGNGGEAYEWALRKAQQMDWSEDSAKALVMIGDELPHPPSYTDQNLFWMDELDVLGGMGVKVYGVQAMNQVLCTPFYQELAERTNGFYLQLRDFNLITDMFLAVCYREADDGQEDADQGQLDAFLDEVEKDGRMTENTKLFMDKLKENPKEQNNQDPSRNRRYVSSEWWDPSLTNTYSRPQYEYIQETDNWVAYGHSTNSNNSSSTCTTPCMPSLAYRSPVTTKKTSKLRQLIRRVFRRQ